MKSENFFAWNLDLASFDALPPEERTAFLVRFAVLAPSGHNSQPWKFIADGDALTVAPDMSRALPRSDADHRQLYLSVGCAIENLCTAAEYYGYRTEISRADVDGAAAWHIRFSGEPSPSSARDAAHRALAIPRRRTNRNPYDAKPPERPFLDWMAGLSGAGLGIRSIDQEPLKTKVAAVVSDALVEAMDDVGFRTELSGYIRPNITRAATGMPMYGFGMPTPLSFIAPFLLKKVNVNRASRKKDEELLTKHTPMFVVIETDADDHDAWMTAGRTYERIALEAERRGIATAPMAAAIQTGQHFRRLQDLCKTGRRPQVFFRIGYAASAPRHSPRIPAANVTALKPRR